MDETAKHDEEGSPEDRQGHDQGHRHTGTTVVPSAPPGVILISIDSPCVGRLSRPRCTPHSVLTHLDARAGRLTRGRRGTKVSHATVR